MKQRNRVAAVVLVAGLMSAGLAGSTAAAADAFPQLVSVSSSGMSGDNSSAGGSMSRDGKLVAFASFASDLVPGDTNGGVQDCFVRDRISGVTTLVSVGEGGVPSDGNCYSPAISADGSVVAFHSLATTLVPDDTNSYGDVFVHDLQSGVTSRVSVDSAGGQLPGGGYWLSPAMSDDGNVIAFTTYTSGTEKVFVHDRTNGSTTRVSLEGCISTHPAISGDGNVVVYDSCAFPGPDGLTLGWQLLAFDRTTGVTALVSVDSSGVPSSGGAGPYQQVSFDGRYVAFDSGSTNLVDDDTNGRTDVFVRDREAGVTTRVSMGGAGDIQGDNHSCWPGISDDGRLVVFTSWATNLVPGDTNGAIDVFSFDRATGSLTRLSANSGGSQGDGDSSTSGQTISGDGRFVAFTSAASNLVAGDTNSQQDVFVTATDWTAATVAVTAEDKMIAVGESLPALTFTASGFVAPDTFITEPDCTTAATGTSTAGSFPITCSGASAPGYVFSYVAGTLTIRGIVSVTVTADDKSITIGDPLPEFTHTDSGLVSPETFVNQPTCTTTATSTSGVGTYPITCSDATAAAWYPLTYVPGTLTINPITVAVTADNKAMTLGDPLPVFTYTAAGFPGPDSFSAEPTCTTTATSASPAGSYPITCTGGHAGANYTITYVPGTLTINARNLTVTADNEAMTVGGPAPALTYSVKGFKGKDTFITSPTCWSPGANVLVPLGSYPIWCSGGVAGGYTIRYVAGTLTVNPPPIATVTADNKTMTAGDPFPVFTYTVQGLQRKDTFTTKPTCSTTAGSNSPPGSYPIRCNGAGAPGYDVRYNTGTLTIQPKPITISGTGSYLINSAPATFTVNANSPTTKNDSLEWSFAGGSFSLKASSLTSVAETTCPAGYARCVSVEGMGTLRTPGQPPRKVGFTSTVWDSGSSAPDAFGIGIPNVALPSSPMPLTNGSTTMT